MTTITRRRGDTYADLVTVTDNSEPPVPIDITGYSFLMTLDPSKTPVDSSNNLYQLVGTITDAVNGKVEFAPSALQANMPSFDSGNPAEPKATSVYWYDIQMIDGLGRIRTIALDKYTYTQDITK